MNPAELRAPQGEDLAQVYQAEIQPMLESLETNRVGVRNYALIVAALMLLLTLLVMLVASRFFHTAGLIFPPFIGFTIWRLIINGPIQEYRSQFKQQVVTRLVQHLNPELSYNPGAGISQEEFCTSQLYPHWIDRYAREDLISGRFGATGFRFSEVHAEYKTTTTDSQGRQRTQWHTIFRGLFFVADFNKHFSGMTFVLPDEQERLLGGLGRQLQALGGKLDSRPGDIVQLEDPEFEREFVVYSTDQVEARYILSTSMMRRMLDFQQRVAQRIALAFVDDSVYIAISTAKRHFEPPSPYFGSARMTLGDIQAYLADVALTRAMVDDLNLNLRIWSRQ